ncbi:MAG: nuclear transport factor 2 family protein [Candidatus Acidiferrales bacterium]
MTFKYSTVDGKASGSKVGLGRCIDGAKLIERLWVVRRNQNRNSFPPPAVLKHTAYEVSETIVRLYGNVALVTTKLHNAGTFGGKPYNVLERQTDVWPWKDGGWKCVLTHEAWEGAEKDQKELSR